ncbi:MAG: type II toxin-antitoxin system HicA family toxin [Spirochaetia bacterium]
MPERPRLTPQDAERRLLAAGFSLVRSKGSHRLYRRGNDRITIPTTPGRPFIDPKIVAQVLAQTDSS